MMENKIKKKSLLQEVPRPPTKVDDSVDIFPTTDRGHCWDRVVRNCEAVWIGTLGKVFTCEDRKTKSRVAVKVIRGIKRYAECGMRLPSYER